LLKHGVELGGDAAEFDGGDGGAAEFFKDGGDAADADSLQIHLRNGQGEGFFAALTFVKSLRIEGRGAVAGLGDGGIHGAAAGVEGSGFEAVGESEPLIGALIGGGLEALGAPDFHGSIDEQADGSGQAFMTVGEEMVEDGIRLVMGEGWFGHGGVGVK